jgi:mRNA-degrading endonuclease RelE of RelBE toxin-antitoxin system
MPAISSTRFDRDYKKLDRLLQHRVNKAVQMLVGDPKRPGLRIERVKGTNEAWSCRVTKSVRIIYRLLDSDRIQLLLVGKHDAAYREGAWYWFAVPAVEEKIPASELEAFQMFTASTNNIEEGFDEIEQLVRGAEVMGEPQIVAGLLRDIISATASEGTAGKAQLHNPQNISGPINVIPSEHEGRCRQVLLGFCFDRDNFGDRLREIAYHAGIHCQEETKLVMIVTSQWDPTEWKKKHEKAFADLNAKVVIFLAAFGKLVRVV